VSNVSRRLEELRERRAARAADRAAFEERRRHGLKARHAAKLAHLAARTTTARAEEEKPEEPENFITPNQGPTPEAAA
jgi:hypothetical protein